MAEEISEFASSEPIVEPRKNDVLCGRGGSINSHPGNERFRLLVEKRKRVYLTARFKREKRLIASSIVSEIRALDPPGLFLARDTKLGCWRDIGDEKARDKTSQALRENAPSIRAEIEVEINEQRAEMQREEKVPLPQPPQHQQPPSYYPNGWGAYPPYFNYHAPPPPGYGPPPPGHHAGPPPPQYDYSHPPHPPTSHAIPHPHYYAQPAPYSAASRGPSKSVMEQTVDLVSSGAESLKNWATGSIGSIAPAEDGASVNSRPIVYVHEGNSRKRRMVKFREDTRKGRPRYPPVNHGSVNSLIHDTNDLEPENLDDHPEASNSVLAHFADRVMGSLGSFDAASVMCGADGGGDTEFKIPFTATSGAPKNNTDEEMDGVEWEGQEVQLLDQTIGDERTMPPPAEVRPRPNYDAASSVGFSSLGSCHSWFPEQISAASSYFRGAASDGSNDGNMSSGGNNSLGGNSLMQIFDQDAAMDSVGPTTASWERSSFRSRSPLNALGSDDESLVSKESNKSLTSRSVDMLWDTRA